MVAGFFDSSVSRFLSLYLLLLSRCVLQSFLGRPAFMCGGRTEEGIYGRAWLAPYRSKRPPLFFVFRADLLDLSLARRVERIPLRRGLWHRSRQLGLVSEYHSPNALHALLPFA